MVGLSEEARAGYISASDIFLKLFQLNRIINEPQIAVEEIKRLEERLPAKTKKGDRSIAEMLQEIPDTVKADVWQMLCESRLIMDELSKRLPYAAKVYATQITLDTPVDYLFESIEIIPRFLEPKGRNALRKAESLRNEDLTFVGRFSFSGSTVELVKRIHTSRTYLIQFAGVEDTLKFAEYIDPVVRRYKNRA